MSDATITSVPSASLGVGTIISESFSILFKNFGKVILIAMIPTLLGLLISGAVVGWGATLGTQDPTDIDLNNLGTFYAGLGFTFVVQMVLYGFIIALLTQLAYEAKLGRPVRLGAYFGPALSAVLPIAILSLVSITAATIAMIALILPGLWVYAVFYVMAPAVVIEKAGFSGLGRSARLTKNYRWPIVGLFILIAIIFIAVGFISTFLSGILGSVVLGLLVTALINSIGSGIGGIAAALTYARLREIKEGVGVDQIVDVFA